MTVIECPVDHVRLALEHTYPVVQLLRDPVHLIASRIVAAIERTVVSYNELSVYA